MPGDVTTTFANNLTAPPGHDDPSCLVQIVIPHAPRAPALKQLFSMNVSRTSLFPGLDGFAQSLGIYHSAFDPMKWV